MLETAPSLSIYTKKERVDGVEDTNNELQEESSSLIRTVTIGDRIDEFSFAKPEDNNHHMDFITEDDEPKDVELLGQLHPPSPPMYLATGLGLGPRPGPESCFGEGIEKEDSEDNFRELLQDYPNHPLVLKYYAQFLKKKGDLEGAEEYYFRAAKADPSDGEVVSQYALLVWELHRDQERASTYFELAIQAAPKDSNVLAAYAKFLWEVDDDGNDNASHLADGQEVEHLQNPVHLHPTVGNLNAEVAIDGLSEGADLKNDADIENYYRSMAEENSSNPLYLKKYAQFLFESKGDLQGAEEVYTNAILANPKDGEILLQYATLLWELYHDQKKTLGYMEQAIEAAPEDSNILAAYARFLWTMEDDES